MESILIVSIMIVDMVSCPALVHTEIYASSVSEPSRVKVSLTGRSIVSVRFQELQEKPSGDRNSALENLSALNHFETKANCVAIWSLIDGPRLRAWYNIVAPEISPCDASIFRGMDCQC